MSSGLTPTAGVLCGGKGLSRAPRMSPHIYFRLRLGSGDVALQKVLGV